ncbi:MAG: hypothetical protein IPH04_19480 [Saprospirales bacterium]|jgi:hypothetical protein|nr:hypothetical protein [Saprospirales bacterium]MBK6904924.1 hypothetical protein [Saprospirales bacterium]MBK7337597.1 hypothetical protein [Saprospirales bacterium]
MSDVVNIVIRVMPAGDELDVELPVFATGKEIIEELLSQKIAPRNDPDGNPYVYKLVSKRSNQEIKEDKTLQALDIKEGETIYFVPKLVAG